VKKACVVLAGQTFSSLDSLVVWEIEYERQQENAKVVKLSTESKKMLIQPYLYLYVHKLQY